MVTMWLLARSVGLSYVSGTIQFLLATLGVATHTKGTLARSVAGIMIVFLLLFKLSVTPIISLVKSVLLFIERIHSYPIREVFKSSTMLSNKDILTELTKEEISILKETYKNVEEAFYVYTLLDVAVRWYGKEGLTVTSPGDAWKEDGSIVVFLDFGHVAVFPYSLSGKYERISEGLCKTSRIDPQKSFYLANIMDTYLGDMLNIVSNMGRKVEVNYEYFFYTMTIEKAKSLQVECPKETYVKKLCADHAEQMNRVWPHRFENSGKNVANWLSINDGYGLFLKENDELVSWAMQGYLGHINLLQTEKEHMGRGYGGVMLLLMAKHIAQSGYVPVAMVLTKNKASNSLFRKQGFESKCKSYFLLVSVINVEN
ncbi:uncharacterized protein LOC123314321 [Coccinella septempunctata]|uniref:uncharacterized protein LOC123314321 n=1 Tax=Coccinella septempunctata TaxID=41139 RepID=UPI001D0852D8|nr:uncharacterized protein LOC123314321 [Coccinella septempunctata]